ncbi:hypothetical protein H6B11_00115 [Mediterraneibacter glycyrrhizinilyticus]|nr:hypothetical protein [Mediterraneibacter glycyrrhizinilyticus]MBM6852586.1 hypothetical protein [Mediterraneibacter glycyrrhizinilyticus]
MALSNLFGWRKKADAEPETNRFCITWNRIPAEEPPGREKNIREDRILS